MRYCVLASGSAGNASVLIAGGFGVLLDLGLGPRVLAKRLGEIGSSWDDVHAALLTHIHTDHWHENTLGHLQRRGIPLYCHRSHASALKYQSPAFSELLENDCLRFYEVGQALALAENIACRPLELRHDGGLTCGFRIEIGPDALGTSWALAYAADLGSWDDELAEGLANVDILAIEFNHDEHLERESGRHPAQIDRVLGDRGHLSNRQAAALVGEVLARSSAGRLRHLVQLHMSRQCNRPELARVAAQAIIDKHSVELHTGDQDCPGPWLAVSQPLRRQTSRPRRAPALSSQQPWLPGWET